MTVRWAIKKILRLFPQKSGNQPKSPKDIAYFFSGTYGDMVQCLFCLSELRRRFNSVEIHFYGSKTLFLDFKAEMPYLIKRKPFRYLLLRAIQPYSLTLCNAVAVYRTGFDWASYFCSCYSLGFRYADESHRKNLSISLPLSGQIANYSRANLELVHLLKGTEAKYTEKKVEINNQKILQENNEDILFHVGSSGMKRDMGLEWYGEVVREVLQYLRGRGKKVHLVAGSADEDVVTFIGEAAELPPNVTGLLDLIRGHGGNIICFNSFMAHACYYLKKPAFVLHHLKIPPGYDCSPLLRQYILKTRGQSPLSALTDYLEKGSSNPFLMA